MWFKVEDTRSSVGQRYIVRCTSEMGGKSVVEERPVQGAPAARKAAEALASAMNVTATVYGKDKDGEFVYGVFELAEGAAEATNPLIKKLFAESAAASLALKDQLLADIPTETIKGFAALAALSATSLLNIKTSNVEPIRRYLTRRSSAFFAAAKTRARILCPPTMPLLRCWDKDSTRCRAGCG